MSVLDDHALAEGRRILGMLPALGAGEAICRIPLHWEVEQYGCTDAHYNLVVSLRYGAWVGSIVTSPRLNATNPVQPGYAPATYERNSLSCSVAVSGMIGATEQNFGAEPVQQHEIEVMCAVAAAVARKYGVDTMGTYGDLPTVFTHAEAAIADHYFPGDGDPDSRWDLSRLRASNEPVTKDEAHQTATYLRTRVHLYKMMLR